ncbi:hypothetical protein D3C76_1076260 [compost metagenome]
MDELRRWQVGLVNLHEVDVDKERLAGFGRGVEKLQRRLFHIVVEERNAHDTGLAIHYRGVDVLAVDLELFNGFFTGLGRQRALSHLGEHGTGFFIHVREPGRVGIGVGIEVIEADVLHHVVTLGIGQCVIGLAQVPLAGEVSLIAAGFQHRCQCPFSRWQTTALALERHRGHAAAVGDAPGLHRGAAWGAAWLGIEGVEGGALCGEPVDARRWHPSTYAAAVGAQVTVASVVGDDEQDIGFFGLGCECSSVQSHE